jgi:hypothetical protein
VKPGGFKLWDGIELDSSCTQPHQAPQRGEPPELLRDRGVAARVESEAANLEKPGDNHFIGSRG